MNANLLRPSELESTWGVRPRRARMLIGELEGLGFSLVKDRYGARLVPRELALAVIQARVLKRPLVSLLDRPELREFLTADAREDLLGAVIELRAELAVLREVLGATWKCVSTSPSARVDWAHLGLSDPSVGL